MNIVLAKFALISLSLFLVGYGLAALLFVRTRRQLRGSDLQKKIHTWVPIFMVVVVLAWCPRWVAAGVLLAVAVAVVDEYVQRQRSVVKTVWAPMHGALVVTGLAALYLLTDGNGTTLLAVWYLSVVSDVTAYFFGNFFGRHNLPEAFNRHKSWEGVMGQLVGAGIGYVLFMTVATLPVWVWPAVGIGAAMGDMANSYVKRAERFKDWSNTIPGHGGFIDRLSSLSYAAIIVSLLARLLTLTVG